MKNYFARLPTPPTEDEKVRIVRRNMLPYYIDRLALKGIRSMEELLTLGRRLEQSKETIESRQLYTPGLEENPRKYPSCTVRARGQKRSPITTAVDTTSYLSTPPRDIGSNFQGMCWNCGKMGHNFKSCDMPLTYFCRGCGLRGVSRPECPHCRRTRLRGNEKMGLKSLDGFNSHATNQVRPRGPANGQTGSQ